MRATRRKATKVKSRASAHRAKGHSREKIAREKWRAALNRAREIESNWRRKFAQKSAEFKHKLTEVAENAYARAIDYVNQEHGKRLVAKEKALATAIAKFEKKFAKKSATKAKRGRKAKAGRHTVHSLLGHQQTATKSTGKKRGRKPGKRSAASATHTTHATRANTGKKRGRKPGKRSAANATYTTRSLHATTGKKRGRKPGRKATKKATIRVSNGRINGRVNSAPARRGRPSKQHLNILPNAMGSYRGSYALQ